MIDAKHPRFPGLRVLVVEDYYLMAESTAMTLTDFGCEVVGPAGQLEKAMELAEHEPLDGALVDINLRGKLAFPVGLILRRRNIPFAEPYFRFPSFSTVRKLIPAKFASVPSTRSSSMGCPIDS